MQMMLQLIPAFFLGHTIVFGKCVDAFPDPYCLQVCGIVFSPSWVSPYLLEIHAVTLGVPVTLFTAGERINMNMKTEATFTGACWVHLAENIISLQNCSCCRSQMLSLLECLWGGQENWIQTGTKSREPQDTDISQMMLFPCVTQ